MNNEENKNGAPTVPITVNSLPDLSKAIYYLGGVPPGNFLFINFIAICYYCKCVEIKCVKYALNYFDSRYRCHK